MKNKLILSFGIAIVLAGAGYGLLLFFDWQIAPAIVLAPEQESVATTVADDQLTPRTPTTPATSQRKVLLDVPFVVQAPVGNWDDPIFQAACEEASIVMAMGWVNGVQKISATQAQNQIQAIVHFENATFGYNTDTNVSDVAKIFQQYFKQPNVVVQENITVENIKQALQNGQLVVVPAFGQALDNPNYTSPGPVEHMLVVVGYDPATREFITNDPGTRRGKGYRYAENKFFAAIWNYPSGPASIAAPAGRLEKAMLVIGK